MFGALRRRLTYANVMATLAVFVALGGSSYAALRITGKNVVNGSLTGTDVANNSLTGKDVKRLTSADIANGRLLAEDFAAGQLPDLSTRYTKEESDARFLGLGATAADAQKLDGLDSTAFLATGAKAADADRLDGKDSADLAPAGHLVANPDGVSQGGARNCEALVGGPSVTVDVGPSGLVAVWAEVRFIDFGTSEGRVQLFEPTDLPSCLTILRETTSPDGAPETRRTLPGSDLGTTGPGSVLVLRVTPGTRTFTLRYGTVPDASNGTNFQERHLWVQPL